MTVTLPTIATIMRVTSFLVFVTAMFCVSVSNVVQSAAPAGKNHRPPAGEKELRYWLENMVWHHRLSTREVSSATGLSAKDVEAALSRFNIRRDNRPRRARDAPLKVLPYPGGRHPRIGFLDGAVDPQRETKVSVFTPWSEDDYVVVDVPEAIWSNLGLTYLAHTHVPTIWTKQNIKLPRLEWTGRKDGGLEVERKLPNGIVFSTLVTPGKDGVRMRLRLTNGTDKTLTGLRVQNCVMLKMARGFNAQTNDNKVLSKPYCAVRDTSGKRWIITAWEPCHRPWANSRCPCLHSDPKFPDCPPGKSQTVVGWLSFYEGDDEIHDEFRRLEKIAWEKTPARRASE